MCLIPANGWEHGGGWEQTWACNLVQSDSQQTHPLAALKVQVTNREVELKGVRESLCSWALASVSWAGIWRRGHPWVGREGRACQWRARKRWGGWVGEERSAWGGGREAHMLMDTRPGWSWSVTEFCREWRAPGSSWGVLGVGTIRSHLPCEAAPGQRCAECAGEGPELTLAGSLGWWIGVWLLTCGCVCVLKMNITVSSVGFKTGTKEDSTELWHLIAVDTREHVPKRICVNLNF